MKTTLEEHFLPVGDEEETGPGELDDGEENRAPSVPARATVKLPGRGVDQLRLRHCRGVAILLSVRVRLGGEER